VKRHLLAVLGTILPLSLVGQMKSGLERYATCRLSSVFQLVQTDRLQGAMARTVETKNGSKQVDLMDGYRVLMTYKQTEPFINMKVEQLRSYARDKDVLVENLGVIAGATAGMESPNPSHSRSAGFDVYGITRKELTGAVLSIYVLFSDSAQTVTTIYFLNAEPAGRKFQTVDEFKKLRDEFLSEFTSCLRFPETK
jgi:hypothetical protein